MPNAYQQYLMNKYEMLPPAPAADGFANFQLNTPDFGRSDYSGGVTSVATPQLQFDSTLNPNPNMADFSQLTAPTLQTADAIGSGMSAGTGSMIGAGIGAAGQAAAGIAQAVGRKAQNDQWIQGNTLDRELRTRLAKMQLEQAQAQFNDSREMNAYDAIRRALSSAGGNTQSQRALKREISRNNVNALQTAFLG